MLIPNNILKAMTAAVDDLTKPGVTEQLLGRTPEYGDLALLTRGYVDEAAQGCPPPARIKAHALLQSITPHTGLCEAGHLPWEMRDGSVRIVSEGTCPHCGGWVEPAPEPTQFDWVRAARVATTITTNVDFGDAAPIPLRPSVVSTTLVRALDRDNVDVLVWLNYYALQHAGGDPHRALQDAAHLPPALLQGYALRAEVRKAKNWTPRALTTSAQASNTRIDLDKVLSAALDAGLTNPSRRSLLLAWIDRSRLASLPLHNTPLDQTRSDIYALYRTGDLGVWLENAARLASHLPISERIHQWAEQVKR